MSMRIGSSSGSQQDVDEGLPSDRPDRNCSERRRRKRSVQGSIRATLRDSPASALWFTGVVLAAIGLATSNPLLTFCAILMLPLMTSLLWFKGESPILLFCCLLQWVQVVASVFYADFIGQSIDSMYGISNSEKATWLCMLGIVALALGMRLAQGFQRRSVAELAEIEVRALSVRHMFMAWMCATLIASFVSTVAWYVPALAQPIYAIGAIKWVAFYILALGVISRDSGYNLLLVAVATEFLAGLFGFFSEFKEVFFILFVAICSKSRRVSVRGWGLAFGSFIVVVLSSVLWTSVKKEFRDYVSEGTSQQKALVPMPARIEKLGDLLLGLDGRQLQDGVESLVLRVSITEQFANTISHVPKDVPYENGKLWGRAVMHLLQPRFLFPNKGFLDDSERTMTYTGVTVAGYYEGTSIGIGYLAESYVDFGPLGMFLPVTALGFFCGWIYRYFAFRSSSRILGLGMATAIVFHARLAETSNVRILGLIVTSSLVMMALEFVFGSLVMRWLGILGKRTPRRSLQRCP